MRRNFLVALLLLAVCAPIVAQTAGTGRDLFIGGSNTASGANWMMQVDRTGKANTLNTGIGGWTVWGNIFGMCMDWNNNVVLVPGIAGTTSPLQIGLYQYDPISMAIVGTLTLGPASSLTMSNWANMDVNSNGNPVTIDNATTPQRLIEWDRTAQKWISSPLPNISAAGGISGLEWDKFNGGYLHACWGNAASTLTPTATPTALFRTTWNGTTTTVAAATGPSLSTYGGTQVDNGDWIASTRSTAYQYYIVKHNTSLYAPGPAGTVNTVRAWEVTAERWAAPGRSFYGYNTSPSRQVVHVDLVTGAATVVFTPTIGTAPEVLPLWNRDIGTARTGKGKWAISIAPDKPKMFPGKPFVLAASLAPPPTGGIVLPDGRQIFIGVDALTVLTVAGPLPPLLTGNIGALNANGRALASLDLSSLGSAANGTVLHFCAAVLDSKAPSGLAWVCEPHAFVVDI